MARKKLSLDTRSIFTCLYCLLLQVFFLIAFSAFGFVVMLAGVYLLSNDSLSPFRIIHAVGLLHNVGRCLDAFRVHIAPEIDLLTQP